MLFAHGNTEKCMHEPTHSYTQKYTRTYTQNTYTNTHTDLNTHEYVCIHNFMNIFLGFALYIHYEYYILRNSISFLYWSRSGRF